ncbi:hypothetical protein DAPK24_041530 [Pichia kluyveri]|uniref:Uncharacterized protein n=1 Tax=Pichia kluyveri TaxID=36015 RepID=A0AAV5R877_PICKL|nr:hypothetical protein DAPK24_041530 [Pichia kluyveri]
MINNDNFRVQLFNLETYAKDKFNRDFLTFSENGTSSVILKLHENKMVENFEKLIFDGWISIKLFISSKLSLFEFLCKYSERCYFISEYIHGSTRIVEYFFDPKKSNMGVINALKPLDGCVMSKNIKIKMDMEVEEALKCLETMLGRDESLEHYQFDFYLGYFLEMDDSECVDKMVLKFEMLEDFLKTHKIRVNDFKIDWEVVLGGGESSQIDSLERITFNDYYVKRIKSILFMSSSFIRCHAIMMFTIKCLKYLETVCIHHIKYVDCVCLGSLKDMKYLKHLIFMECSVDHLWMNEFLPDCI